MKKFLGSRGVKEDIINFDAHAMRPANRAAVAKLLASNASSFEERTITRASVAAAPLAIWVRANMEYAAALDTVAPLEQAMAKLQASLDVAQRKVDQCQGDLRSIEAEVQALQEDFGERTAAAERLKMGLQKATEQLASAQTLLSKLGGETDRWDAQAPPPPPNHPPSAASHRLPPARPSEHAESGWCSPAALCSRRSAPSSSGLPPRSLSLCCCHPLASAFGGSRTTAAVRSGLADAVRRERRA